MLQEPSMVTLIYPLGYEDADSLTVDLGFLSASAHNIYEGLRFVRTLPACHGVYPSEKITKFEASVDSIANTNTTLHQVVLEAAKQHGITTDSMKEELAHIFHAAFEELKVQFPAPGEAPGHGNRATMISAVLDHIEEGFIQFAVKHGVSEEILKRDLVEHHPNLADTFLVTTIFMLLPELWLLRPVLRLFGFGS
ncbi:hypothetical protein AZE42_05027 [Rhizopogon vesiculosus]|uniref:Uncharacterized protein n=1 Tax=Rhizopogon vesiculosus TaxID=180088 RepID=A0A1J8PWQ5_9AGAM|nr:hypothetical protein AZE42_05027 [Rhizopogon vesiculosus]